MCSWELRVRGHRRVTDMDVGDWASSNKSSHADKNTAPIQIPKSKSSETQNFLVLYLSSKCDLTLKCWCPYITWTVRPFFFPLTVSIRIFTEKTFMDLNLGHLHNTWYIHHITVLKFEKKSFILKHIQCQGFQKRDYGTVINTNCEIDTTCSALCSECYINYPIYSSKPPIE